MPQQLFSLTSENLANILEHNERDVKQFFEISLHSGFSPVLNRSLMDPKTIECFWKGHLTTNHRAKSIV